MNVIQLTIDYTADSGGSSVSVHQFHTALGSQVISLTHPDALKAQGSYSGDALHFPTVDNVLGRKLNLLNRANTLELKNCLSEADFVFCHKLFRYHNHVLMEVAARAGVPYAVIPHGSLDPYVFSYRRLRKSLWMRQFGRKMLSRAKGVVVASAGEMEKAAVFVSRDKLRLCYWPVPVPPQVDKKESKSRVVGRYSVPSQSQIWITLCRLSALKRLKELIRGFGFAARPDCVLIIAGPDGDYSRLELEEYAEARGVRNVRIVGPVVGEVKDDLFAAASLFVNISHRENFGYSVVEALSHGVPSLLSPGNDLAATLFSHGCCIVCDGYSDRALVDAFKEFEGLPLGRRGEMAGNGVAWVATNTSFDAFRARVEALVGA